jgi:hypothetical protein
MRWRGGRIADCRRLSSLSDGFRASCREVSAQQSPADPSELIISAVMSETEPRWPMIFQPSEAWRVDAGDFDERSEGDSHTGWGRVDSVLRRSPTVARANRADVSVTPAIRLADSSMSVIRLHTPTDSRPGTNCLSRH